MYIIPAIDILNKKVVRLREGDYGQVTEYDVTLEEMIDECMSLARNLDPERLAGVVATLRQARNQVVDLDGGCQVFRDAW